MKFIVLNLVFPLLYFYFFFVSIIFYLLKGRKEKGRKRKKEKGGKAKRKRKRKRRRKRKYGKTKFMLSLFLFPPFAKLIYLRTRRMKTKRKFEGRRHQHFPNLSREAMYDFWTRILICILICVFSISSVQDVT